MIEGLCFLVVVKHPSVDLLEIQCILLHIEQLTGHPVAPDFCPYVFKTGEKKWQYKI